MTELPVGLRAEHTIIHPNVNGVTVVLGQERISIGDEMDAQNRVTISARIEWVHGVHLTPVAAKLLQRQMTEFVTEYERKFGVIPLDLPPEPPKEVSPGVVQLRPTPGALLMREQAEWDRRNAEWMAERNAEDLGPPQPAFVPVGLQVRHHPSDATDPLELVRWWLGSKKPPAV